MGVDTEREQREEENQRVLECSPLVDSLTHAAVHHPAASEIAVKDDGELFALW